MSNKEEKLDDKYYINGVRIDVLAKQVGEQLVESCRATLAATDRK